MLFVFYPVNTKRWLACAETELCALCYEPSYQSWEIIVSWWGVGGMCSVLGSWGFKVTKGVSNQISLEQSCISLRPSQWAKLRLTLSEIEEKHKGTWFFGKQVLSLRFFLYLIVLGSLSIYQLTISCIFSFPGPFPLSQCPTSKPVWAIRK